jgi:hypothetical protein
MKEMVRKNGTFSLDGLAWGDSNRVGGEKMSCPVCYAVLGHECVMRPYALEIDGITFLMWICDCLSEEDCGFAYPDGLAENEIWNLFKERQIFLNSLGIGINQSELDEIFSKINQENASRMIAALENRR